MPADQKRINGPESSVPYHLHAIEQLQDYETRLASILTDKRRDGRKLNEMRKICKFEVGIFLYLPFDQPSSLSDIKRGPLSQAKGSAYIELGETKVAVSVFDPREIPKQNKFNTQGELYCDFKFSPFACVRRRPPMPDSDEKSLARALHRALMPAVCRQEFPNFQVDIFVNVLEDDGSALAAAITAAGLALADAGIPMYDIVTATTCGILDDQLFLDPSRAEEELCMASVCSRINHGITTVARLANHEQISEVWSCGSLSADRMDKAVDVLVKSNQEVSLIIEEVLVKRVEMFLRKEKATV